MGIVRFPSEREARLIRHLSQMLSSPEYEGFESISEEDAVKRDDVSVLDSSGVFLIRAKTEEGKRVLSRFVPSGEEAKTMPELDFVEKEGKPSKARFSIEYLTKIIEFLSITSDFVDCSLIFSRPCVLENDHFSCVLAPRLTAESGMVF